MKLLDPVLSPTAVEATYVFQAAPEKVFAAWTDPAKLAKWFHPAPDAPDAQVEVDLRVGGRYRLGVPSSQGEVFWVGGEYTLIEPPHKLAFTWRWEMADEAIPDTLVVLEFRPKDEGTELYLRHEGFDAKDHGERDGHAIGWKASVENLYEFLGEEIERTEPEED